MRVPKQAKLVFKGVVWEVYQWQQKLFDGSKATFELLKRPNTLQVIPVMGDKIAIGYEEQPTKGPFDTLLGGRQNENETPLEGAKRELLEEAGLATDNWKLYDEISPYNKIEWKIYTFIARGCKKVRKPKLDPGEKIDMRLVDFDEFVKIVTSKEFYGKELALQIFRMLQDEKKLEEFKNKLFK